MNNIKILRANLDDAVGIARISYQVGKMHDDAVPEYFRPTDEKEHLRMVTDMLKEENVVTFKAVLDGKICGFLFLEIRERDDLYYSKFGIITNLGVDEVFRGRGIGSLLIAKAEEYVKKQKLEVLDLDVFDFNVRARVLFEKIGFTAIDVYMRKFLKNVNKVENKSSIVVLRAEVQDIEDISPIFYQLMDIRKSDKLPLFKTLSKEECLGVVRDIIEGKMLLFGNRMRRANFKAVIDGKIVGFLSLIIKNTGSKGMAYPNYGYVGNIVVDKNYRKQGVGVKLIETAEDYLYTRGLEVLDLDVSAFNQNAIDFYRHLSFYPIDVSMRKVLK